MQPRAANAPSAVRLCLCSQAESGEKQTGGSFFFYFFFLIGEQGREKRRRESRVLGGQWAPFCFGFRRGGGEPGRTKTKLNKRKEEDGFFLFYKL